MRTSNRTPSRVNAEPSARSSGSKPSRRLSSQPTTPRSTCATNRANSSRLSSRAKWSAETFVTTAQDGRNRSSERSLSSASTTQTSERPIRTFPTLWSSSQLTTIPPLTTVGSAPRRSKAKPTIPVTVVLPEVPVIATVVLSWTRRASISALRMTGTPRRRAVARSGLSSSTAVLATTASVRLCTPDPSWGKRVSPARQSLATVAGCCPVSR